MSLFGVGIEVYVINILIGILVFFFLRWLLKKTRLPNKIQRLLTWAGTVVLTPIIYIVLFFTFIFSITYYPDKPFNQQKWMANPSERYEMSQNLIESELLIGKTKIEVKELLGSVSYKYSENHWAYSIGFIPGITIDPSVLDVYFKNGKVVKVTQHET